MDIKLDAEVKHLEIIDNASRSRQQFYKPVTDEEKALDRRVNLKLDFCVVAILAINFILCGIDKTNVAFVATSSFSRDANLKRDDIPNSLSLFSATYVPLQPLSTMMNHIVGPRVWMTFQLLAWGSICMAHAGIRNSATLVALRLLLGAAEAGFTQNGMYFMSTLYPKYSVGFRMGLFAGMYSIAGAFAGLIAYGLLRIESKRIHGWQAVFLFEGGLTVLMALVTYVILPKSLATAWFLTPAERQHAVHRMNVDLDGTQEMADINGGGITRRDLVDVAKDWRKLSIVACNVLSILPVTAFTTFLPLIVEGMGYEGTKASLMSVPPFVVGVAGLLIVVYSSDHFHERSLHTVGGMALGLVGCLVMAVSGLHQEQLRYGFAHVCMAGIFISGPLIAAWLANNTPWRGTRSVILGVNGWSNLAGVIAGQIFKDRYAPSYRTPLIITMSLIAVGMLGFVFVRVMLMAENRRRAAVVADWDEQNFEDEARSEKRRGDQRYTFVYGM